ncbi:MAG: Jag N-terminal domain-containing protein [Deltaproteobacteria bacterium]|nr:Jag N-terminal domain-containing protein [Deltaproteobacteria bacterium]
MEYVEAEGDTIDEAIKNALKMLGVERDKVSVDILSEGRKGILGFGSQKARVRATLRKILAVEEQQEVGNKSVAQDKLLAEQASAMGLKGKSVLEEILRLMGMEAAVEMKPGDTSGEVVLDIRGESGGLLIGRRGQTLEALQYLVTRIIGERQEPEGAQVVVDAENYRERRRKSLEDMALRLGEKAKRQRKTVSVDSLSAADRRIIHVALQDDPWLTTKSLGRGAYRRLLIIPEGDRRKKTEESSSPSAKQASKGQR